MRKCLSSFMLFSSSGEWWRAGPARNVGVRARDQRLFSQQMDEAHLEFPSRIRSPRRRRRSWALPQIMLTTMTIERNSRPRSSSISRWLRNAVPVIKAHNKVFLKLCKKCAREENFSLALDAFPLPEKKKNRFSVRYHRWGEELRFQFSRKHSAINSASRLIRQTE